MTVGASLLSNAAKRGLVPQGLDRLKPGDPKLEVLEKIDARPLVEYAAGNPEECCAELNTVVKAARRWEKLFSEDVAASIYASDTEQGRFISKILREALCRVLNARSCTAAVKVVEGLGAEEEFKTALLRLAAAIRSDFTAARREGRLAYLVASGGFKPESTFAVIAAYIAGANGIFYVHESFQKLVDLPMLPLQIKDAVVKYAEGRADEYALARELGLDVGHLEEVGLLKGRERKLDELIQALI